MACRVIRDTEWVTNPANLTDSTRDIIQRGEMIWLHRDNFATGSWQQARLADNTLRYVQHHDFVHEQSDADG